MSVRLKELYEQLDQATPGSPESTEIADQIVREIFHIEDHLDEYRLPTGWSELK